jgi:TGF-beta propeptide
MRALVTAIVCAALWAAGGVPAAVVSIPPETDVGLPFWCDWSYDWESRCYRDDGQRLPIGGVDDKVWRAALRFSLASVPAGAAISSAELSIYHDGTCVAPRLGSVPCAVGYVVDAHRILSPPWSREREPDFDERVLATDVVLAPGTPQWLRWDVTALVRSWQRGPAASNGVLLKLQDGDETYGSSGPYGPSASSPRVGLRPRLSVQYGSVGG